LDFDKSRLASARRSTENGADISQESETDVPKRNRKILIAAVVILVLVGSTIGYYEYSGYEHGVLSTSVYLGTISNIVSTSAPSSSNPLGNIGGSSANSGASLVTIKFGSTSFTQIVPCSTQVKGAFPYAVGQTLKVAEQQLRDGGVAYAPDMACKGSVSPYAALHITQTVTTISTSTTA
jgi:hypothetical protein